MIYRTVNFAVKPGKMQEARQLLLDFAAHSTDQYGHVVEVLSSISGPSNRLHAVGRYESLSVLETVVAKYKTDSKGQEIIAKIPEFFENGYEVSLFRVES